MMKFKDDFPIEMAKSLQSSIVDRCLQEESDLIYWIHDRAKASTSELMQILLSSAEPEAYKADSGYGGFCIWVLFLDFGLCESAGHFREVKKYANTIYNQTGIGWIRFLCKTPGEDLRWNVFIEEESGTLDISLEESFLRHAK